MLTAEQTQKINETLAGMPHLSKGIGNAESACSIAAINLALSGRLTDEIPECMSRVIGRWIIRVQDEMPEDMRNSRAWRELLPLAAGTGREREKQRAKIAIDWMWEALAIIQPIANSRGFGPAWAAMCRDRTRAAAAAAAADAATYAAADATYAAADAANAAAYAAADAAADAAAAATDAAYAAAAAAYAANAAAYAAAAADIDFWPTANPIRCLREMIEV